MWLSRTSSGLVPRRSASALTRSITSHIFGKPSARARNGIRPPMRFEWLPAEIHKHWRLSFGKMPGSLSEPRRSEMLPVNLFRIQLVLGYLAWLLCFTVYLWPWLREVNRFDAQRAIATLHSFRFFGLVFILPGVTGPNVPAG